MPNKDLSVGLFGQVPPSIKMLKAGGCELGFRHLGQCAAHLYEVCGKSVAEFQRVDRVEARRLLVRVLQVIYFPTMLEGFTDAFAHQELRRLGGRMQKLASGSAPTTSDEALSAFCEVIAIVLALDWSRKVKAAAD